MTCMKEIKISPYREFYDEYLKSIHGHENQFSNNKFMNNTIQFILPQNLETRFGIDSYSSTTVMSGMVGILSNKCSSLPAIKFKSSHCFLFVP